ncbi:hypothetical protein SNEBB_004451 [Seison nebaliae]|nr:hypothetical protein SNEBB_004451 [Seison nebaliae]
MVSFLRYCCMNTEVADVEKKSVSMEAMEQKKALISQMESNIKVHSVAETKCHLRSIHNEKDVSVVCDDNIDCISMDLITKLTFKQRYQLRASWKGIRRDFDSTASTMFGSLFENNEDIREKFQKFGNYNQSNIYSSESFKEHALIITAAIDKVVTILHHQSSYEYLFRLGQFHISKNLDPEVFQLLKKPFLHAVKNSLDERYTLNMQNIYSHLIDYIINTMIEGLQFSLNKRQKE